MALLLLVAQGSALAEAGRIQFVHGEVYLIHADGKQMPALKGDEVNEGDIITTASLSQAQLLMKDEGVIALRPDSRMRIDVYRFSGKEDGSERGVFGLLKGGFRAITGLIGRSNKDNYKIRTETATIGIRGTDHEPLYIPPPAPGETPIGPPGTYDKVNVGSTYLETAAGRVELGINQVGFVPATGNTPPVRLPSIPDFLKATPGLPASARQGGAATGQGAGANPAPASGSATNENSTPSSSANPSAAAPTDLSLLSPPLPALVPPSPTGAFNPANPTGGGGVLAPNGTAIAGGGMGSGGPSNGAGFIGDPSGSLVILLDAGGALATVAGNNFSYSRNGAPLIMSGSATLGGESVKWGIYNGGSMVDGGVTSSDTLFFWMASTSASTSASLLSAMPTPGASLSFASTAGFTAPITETGGVGGSVSTSIVLKNLAGVPSIFSYNLTVNDVLGRSWAASLVAPQSLDSLRSGSTQNLSGTCSGCALTSVSGNVQGVAIGNPLPVGMISSYKMTAGSSAVVGSVATH